MNGGLPLSAQVGRVLVDARQSRRSSDHELTEREREVLTLVMKGLANKQIAIRLGIPSGTVRSRLTRADGMLARKLASLLPSHETEGATP